MGPRRRSHRLWQSTSPPANHQTEAAAEAEAEALASAMEAQTIIRDEAFRCKEITSRLLSLARRAAAMAAKT